jgi:hypothetical protein
MRTPTPCERRAERGTALILSLLALLCLTLVGGLFVANTKTETQIAGHEMRHSQSLYNAEAGCAEVLARMSNQRDTTNYIGQPGQSWNTLPGWGRYVVLTNGNSGLDPDVSATETDGLDNDGDTLVDESGETYPEVATAQSGSTVDYPWVKVRYKLNGANQVLLYGDHDDNPLTDPAVNLARGYPIIVATSAGAQGSARRLIEVEAVKPPFQTVEAATYAEDDNFNFNGTQFLVSGRDWDPDTGLPIPGAPEVNGILTTEDPSVIAGALNHQQQNNVEGSGAEPSVASSPINLDLQALADQFSDSADYTLAGGTYSNTSFGGRTDYVVAHCTGDMHVSGSLEGGGLLIVDGDFDCTGGFTWYGLVLVLGDMRFSGGGNDIHIYGSVLCQGGIGNQTVSGNADILYSSIALERMTSLAPYRQFSWREL